MKKHKAVLNDSLRQEFQKDLELFKYFLLLLNDSSPIRNVELMWAEELELLKTQFKDRVSTGDALVQLQPAGAGNRNSPSTLFCDLVHGFGRHEEETCAKSDEPAKKRCQASGCSQIYACHVGLTDVAVPVISEGQYLGTLFSGQVLTEAPTAEGFEKVKQTLASQPHIDFALLEAAYFKVPVVEKAQPAEMVRILELFARYIANSWKRLEIMGHAQRVRDREVALNRKQLAAILLSGEIGDKRELDSLAVSIGLQRLPDRLLVLRIRQDDPAAELRPQIANTINMSRLTHVVEDLCQNWNNTIAISGRPDELCIFTRQEARNSRHGHLSLREMADSVLMAVRAQGMGAARIGISGVHDKPEDLLRGYHEACSALNDGDLPICFFEDSLRVKAEAGQSLGPLVKAIQQGQRLDSAIRDFLVRSMPANGSTGNLQQTRALLTWATEHLALEMINIGTDAAAVGPKKEQFVVEILNSPNPFALGEVFRRFAEFLAKQVEWTFSERANKIVLAVHRLAEERGVAKVTIREISDALSLSSGHLSRLYSRSTGMTLEEYLIRQRVELAKRMLLDPRLNVAEVAERCGFCNPAYFASVFKKYAHCTPRGFASRPYIWKATPAAEAASPVGGV